MYAWKMTGLILPVGLGFALWMNCEHHYFSKWMFFALVKAELLATWFKLTLILSTIRSKQADVVYEEVSPFIMPSLEKRNIVCFVSVWTDLPILTYVYWITTIF